MVWMAFGTGLALGVCAGISIMALLTIVRDDEGRG